MIEMTLSEQLKKVMPEADQKAALVAYLDKCIDKPQKMTCKIESDIACVKQENGEEYYKIEGYVSTYGNIDKGCDRVEKGAFNEDLADNGNERPILWQHDRTQPIGIGYFRSDEKGLYAEILLPKADSFVAERVYPQLKIGSVKKFSIGYELKDYHITEENGDMVFNLSRIALREASPVTFPMNEECDITAVKAEIVEAIVKETPKAEPETEQKPNNIEEKAVIDGYECRFACVDDNIKVTDAEFDDMDEYLAENEIDAKDVSFVFGEKTFYFAGLKDSEVVVVPSRLAEAIGYITDDMPTEKGIINSYYKKLGKDEPFKEDGSLTIDKYTLRNLGRKSLSELLFAKNVVFTNNAKDALAEAVSTTGELGEKHETVSTKGVGIDLFEAINKEFNKLEK
jgi:HK97 family phage prohead protease